MRTQINKIHLHDTHYTVGEHPSLLPPKSEVGLFHWLRKNLFSSVFDTVLTLIAIYALWKIVPPLLNWALFDATWMGITNEYCQQGGACWSFINARFEQFIYGFYPQTERWRVDIVFILLALCIAYLIIPRTPKKAWAAVLTFVGLPILAFILLFGGKFGLVKVPTEKWGGLMLTLVISFIGIVASLPIGILLALGRQSNMPIVKSLSIAFIELWRGVPLITVLFMSSVMFPLFMPEGVNFDKLLRALIGVALFSSAYMAEVVHGGLQAVPKGQTEAAQALGLTYWKTMGFIVLPQALKTVIPGIVNTFIGLFKDTTLVLIIGLFDFLGIIQAAAQDPQWLNYLTEGYVFAAIVYFTFCFGMSRYSMHLEKQLDTSHR